MSCDPRTYPYIGHSEGTALRAYRCPANVITIGNGFTMASRVFADYWLKTRGHALKLGDTLRDKAESLSILRSLIDGEYLPPVEQAAPKASPHAKGACTSMAFNCGKGALKWSWFSALKAGNIKDAAARLRVTAVTAKGRRLPGLVRRRSEEAAILESNAWPAWLRASPMLATAAPAAIEAAMPVEPLQIDDRAQGLIWLSQLGYLWASDVPVRTNRAEDAIRRFQRDHKQLTVDGIMGVATLDQLQRSVDVKRRLAQAASAGGVTAAAGQGDQMGGITGYGEWLMAGGLVLGLGFMLWFAWRYRDELKIAFMPKKRA